MSVTFKLCSCNGCCPEVSFDDDKVYLTDDHGGKLQLTKDEFRELVKVSDWWIREEVTLP